MRENGQHYAIPRGVEWRIETRMLKGNWNMEVLIGYCQVYPKPVLRNFVCRSMSLRRIKISKGGIEVVHPRTTHTLLCEFTKCSTSTVVLQYCATAHIFVFIPYTEYLGEIYNVLLTVSSTAPMRHSPA
jgi:hypothetical protein